MNIAVWSRLGANQYCFGHKLANSSCNWSRLYSHIHPSFKIAKWGRPRAGPQKGFFFSFRFYIVLVFSDHVNILYCSCMFWSCRYFTNSNCYHTAEPYYLALFRTIVIEILTHAGSMGAGQHCRWQHRLPRHGSQTWYLGAASDTAHRSICQGCLRLWLFHSDYLCFTLRL